jgi:outer membrane receptor for ferrienterochelin and colicins
MDSLNVARINWIFVPRSLVGSLFVFLLFLFTPCLSAADEPPEPASLEKLMSMSLEELINVDITLATGSPKPIRTAPAVASVITAADIERRGATTLDEALEAVPGLHIVPSGLDRLSSIYSIRGIHTKLNPHVLLLINGIPYHFAHQNNRPPLFRMPVAMISRVEVVRGPGSAVHGADAFAGTINVITKDGKEIDGTRAGLRYGSFQTYDAWAQHGGTYKGWDVVFSVETQASDGDHGRIIDQDAYNIYQVPYHLIPNGSLAPAPLDTKYDIFNAHLGLKKDNWTFRLWGWLLDDGAMGPGGLQILTQGNKQYDRSLLADLIYHKEKVVTDLDLDVRLYHLYAYVDALFQFAPDGTAPAIFGRSGYLGNPIGWDHDTGLEITTFYTGWHHHRWRLAAGATYIEEDTDQYKNFGPGVVPGVMTRITDPALIFLEGHSRTIWNVSLQDEWSLAKNWELTAGVRYDRFSDFGGTTNPRAALVWEPRSDLVAKLMYGRAFRPPSFAERYAKSNPVAVGNEDIDPETIDTYEVAFDYHPVKAVKVTANLFYYKIDGLIEYLPIGGGVFQAENARDQEGRGFELEMDWQATDTFRLRTNYAYQRAKDSATGQLVPDAPGMQFYVDAFWALQQEWSLDAQLNWVGNRHRAAGDARPEIADYTKVDLTVRRKNIAKHWDFALAVRNLFDADIREPSDGQIPNDYPMEGRSIFGEVRYTF